MKKKFLTMFCVLLLISLTIVEYQHYYSRKICAAIDYRETEKLEELIKRSPNINALTNFDFLSKIDMVAITPLRAACSEKDFDTIKLLLENGANPNKKVYNKHPILYFATNYHSKERDTDLEQKYLNTIKLMIEHGAKVNVEYYGQNIIHLLAQWNNYTCIKYLLENYDFDINSASADGSTALMNACLHIYPKGNETVELLLSKGADKSIKDIYGKTALDYAIESERFDCIELLTAYK